MLTLDSGSVSLSRSADGDSVQTIWLVGRHSDPFTLDNTVLCCVTVAPLGMFLLAYLFDTYPLIFESHAALSQFLGICFVIGLRYYWVCHLGKICNIFFYCLHRCEKCYAGTGLHSISCFNRLFQSARSGCTHENFFCVNAFLFCSSVSSLLPAIFSCRAIRLRHVLCLSDCPTSFTLLFFNVAVVSDSSRKYAVGYSLLCSCCWQLDFCVK